MHVCTVHKILHIKSNKSWYKFIFYFNNLTRISRFNIQYTLAASDLLLKKEGEKWHVWLTTVPAKSDEWRKIDSFLIQISV